VTSTQLEDVKSLIRGIPDFPRPGVLFRDITPLLANAWAFKYTTDLLAERINLHDPDAIVAIESRGFIFGSAVALRMGLPLQLVRKQGKLPGKSVGVVYQLEYGEDRVEIHEDAITRGQSYALIDDLIATGGTAAAAADLIELQGGALACCAFIIELSFLRGRKQLGNRPVESLICY
jgi:adenine phosphoribosyltransferase